MLPCQKSSSPRATTISRARSTVPAPIFPRSSTTTRSRIPYYDHDVAIIGAKNSAAIAALELWWTGARVTLIHRGPGIHNNVKYWIKPNIENRIKNGEIPGYFNSEVTEIRPDSIQCPHRKGTSN